MNDILNITCEVMETTPERVLLPRTATGAKCSKLSTARQMSMTFAYRFDLGTLDQIGTFHNRSHSAVIAASKTVKNDISTNKHRNAIYNLIRNKINEKIRNSEPLPERDYLDDLLDGE
jgi:chromosomal replication initiation ATPase DnaA